VSGGFTPPFLWNAPAQYTGRFFSVKRFFHFSRIFFTGAGLARGAGKVKNADFRLFVDALSFPTVREKKGDTKDMLSGFAAS